MHGVIAQMKNVESSVLLEFGEHQAIVTGNAYEAHEAFFFKLHGAID